MLHTNIERAEEAVGVPKDVYGCAVVGGMVF